MKHLITLCTLITLTIFSFGQDFLKNAVPEYGGNTTKIELKKLCGKNHVSGTWKQLLLRLDSNWLKLDSVNLYGGGSLLGIATASSETEESASPSGSVGFNFKSKRLSGNIYYSYNGKKTTDVTTLSNFGSSLMNPNTGGQSFSLSLDGRLNRYFGFYSKYQISDNIWKYDSINEIDASPVVWKAGLYLRPFDFNLKSNQVDFTISFLGTHRTVSGQFNNDSRVIDGTQIKPRGYNGYEVAANLFVNNVNLFVQFSNNAELDFEIPNFTGSQILFGIGVSGEFIKLK